MSDTHDTADDATSHGKILRANVIGPSQIQTGMTVTSVDDQPIGKVKAVGETEFLVDRPMARDVWVPFTAVIAAEGHGDGFRAVPPRPTEIVLSVSGAHIEEQGWRHP